MVNAMTKKKHANFGAINKIVVPYDFSSFSEAALVQAVSLAKIYNSGIDLIHVITPIYVGKHDADLLPERDTFYSRLIKATEIKLKKKAENIATGSSLKINVKSYLGIVHHTILKHAKKVKADLIVMGTHGVSGFKEFFAGSNAFRVVNESVCPVITIQHKTSKPLFKKIMLVITKDSSIDTLTKNVAKLAQSVPFHVIITSHNLSDKEGKGSSVKQMIKLAETEFKKQGISVSKLNLKETDFIKSVIANAKKHKADVIAVSTDKKFHLSLLLSGSYAQQLVNHSTTPVLSVS